ncbi:hypothetical protein HDV62DRAFT_132882 [Trichoderma sp. SZMC 28011]
MDTVHLGILGTPSKKCRLDAFADAIQALRNACEEITKGPILIQIALPLSSKPSFGGADRARSSKSMPYGAYGAYGAEDIEWSCSASLPEEFKLGNTDVICQGYASSDDPYVLKGSCGGVEYRLILTDKGEKRYPDVANLNGHWSSDGEGGTDLGAWAFAVIFFAVLTWILYLAYLA